MLATHSTIAAPLSVAVMEDQITKFQSKVTHRLLLTDFHLKKLTLERLLTMKAHHASSLLRTLARFHLNSILTLAL
jgi:hypothetical protein